MTQPKRNKLTLFICRISVCAVIFQVTGVFAHSPHDIIDKLEISPDFAQDETLFISIDNQLKRSSDGGYAWKDLVNGLDNRHNFSSIVCSPSFKSDKTVLVSTKGDGVYRSQNKGIFWEKINSGLDNLHVHLLIVPPFRSDRLVIFASTDNGLYKTIDRGSKWYPVLRSAKVTAISFIPPAKNQRIIAGDAQGSIYLSADEGETWSKQSTKPGWGAIQTIAISTDLESGQLCFVGTEKRGVYKTLDGGKSFIEINRGMPEAANVMSIAISPDYQSDKTVYATTWYEALYISTNEGESWQKYDDGLTTDRQADSRKYRSAHFRNIKIARRSENDLSFYLAGFDGLFKSDEGGKKWTELETLPIRRIMGLGVSPSRRGKISVGITTYGGGAYSTETNGHTWKINNMGLVTTRLSDIVFSPNYPVDSIFFSSSHKYLLKFTNRGAHWTKVSLSIKNWRKFGISILKRLKIPTGRLQRYILSAYERSDPFATVIALSPNFSSDQTLFFGTRRHGIFRSVDGGAHNRVVWKAMEKVIDSLVLSPIFHSDRTLFAGIRGAGVYKSVDNGESWQQTSKLAEGQFSNYLVGISNDFKSDRSVFVGTSEGLYKTTDAGENWHLLPVTENAASAAVNALAVSPNYKIDQTLLMSIKGKGIYKSKDGGKTFRAIALSMKQANHQLKWIQFSNTFATDRIIYAASYEELFCSKDGGHTWQLIKRPVRYENHRDVVRYEGDWKRFRGENLSASQLSYTNSANAAVRLRFVGSGVSVIGPTSNDYGKARVYVDGDFQAEIDQFNETAQNMMEIYSIKDLPRGPHEITIETLNKKNASTARVAIDAFDIAP
jgi:photosystem II stability/assembly factor-like uncharacterized protein